MKMASENKLSKRISFVAGNWKMNKTLREAKELATEVVRAASSLLGAEIVLCPPFTALSEVAKTIEGSSVQLAGQDVFWEEKGAFTGEISGLMLKDVGCQYVIVGHSERRQILGEDDLMINRKLKAALRQQIFPILCIGETLEERDSGKTLQRIESQLKQDLNGLNKTEISQVVVAYEPVWAIGTGRNATPSQAQEVHQFIRQILGQSYGQELASCAIIIYGGSVKPENAYSLMAEPDIDGFLVGGASLEAKSFIKIIEQALRAKKEKE